MACLATDISFPEAAITSILFTSLYVGVLYLPFNAGERDARHTIVSRITTLFTLSLALELYTHNRVPLISTNALTKLPDRVHGTLAGLILTLLLYTGHLAVTPTGNLAALSISNINSRFRAFRNYLAGPLLEEIVFRKQTLQIWTCQSPLARLLFPAAMFSLAHAHHIRRLGIVSSLFQMTYTFLFGVYATALYINTGTLFAPLTAHMVCNILELPNFVAIARHPRSRVIMVLYGVALLTFIISFAPITLRMYPLALRNSFHLATA